jgi:putative transferase (TIGR04331 family)
MQRLCLSPLTITSKTIDGTLFSGSWCLIEKVVTAMEKDNISCNVVQLRKITKKDYYKEAELCIKLYDKYIEILSVELNRINKVNYSIRYWNTLLHSFLNLIVSSTIDHYHVLIDITDKHENLVADIIDYRQTWFDPHNFPGGSSRILHLMIYSIIVDNNKSLSKSFVDNQIVRSNLLVLGDGKKSSPSEATVKKKIILFFRKHMGFLMSLRSIVKGELPLKWIKFININVLALGDQYLTRSLFKSLFRKLGCAPFYFSAKGWKFYDLQPVNLKKRASIKMPGADSELELAVQKCILQLLPTVYLENYQQIRSKIDKVVPERKMTILNSQHCNGGNYIDFFIAHSVAHYQSHHLMICHGGCYGVMDVSVQEQVWTRMSDTYAMWNKPKSYFPECTSIKLPSLRFQKWLSHSVQPTGKDIVFFATGHYPNRYAYNSIFPYTIDDVYDKQQIDFMSALDDDVLESIFIRDFHHSERISANSFIGWARSNNIRVVTRGESFQSSLIKSKLAVHVVPQTTYLETIVLDYPTIVFWNPEVNYIRDDLYIYFEQMIEADVIHLSPESAANQINKIANNPLLWWRTSKVQSALKDFRENVCYTSRDGLDEWSDFIKKIDNKPFV